MVRRLPAVLNESSRCLCRKRLYQNVYEYDLPLFNPSPCRFEFVSPEESELPNPWKESFRQLYRGIHVRVGYQDMQFRGRNLHYFNTVQVRTKIHGFFWCPLV